MNTASIAAGEREFHAAAQEHRVISVRQWTEFSHVLDIHDDGAMNSNKKIGTQHLFEFAHRHADGVALGDSVEDDVVVVGLDPLHILRLKENHASAAT